MHAYESMIMQLACQSLYGALLAATVFLECMHDVPVLMPA